MSWPRCHYCQFRACLHPEFDGREMVICYFDKFFICIEFHRIPFENEQNSNLLDQMVKSLSNAQKGDQEDKNDLLCLEHVAKSLRPFLFPTILSLSPFFGEIERKNCQILSLANHKDHKLKSSNKAFKTSQT